MTINKNFITAFAVSFIVYVLAFLFIYFTHVNTLILQSEDYLGTAALPFSLLKEGNFDLNEYYSEMVAAYPQPDNPLSVPYYLREHNGNYYSIRPVLTAFLALPSYVIPVILNIPVNIETLRVMSRIGGAFIVALSAGYFYLILERLIPNKRLRIFLWIIYCFGTNSFSTNSQGLWQHGTSQLLLCVAFYYFLKDKIFATALALGLAVIGRPTNLLSYVVFGLYILMTDKISMNSKLKKAVVYGLGGLIPIIFELTVNKLIFGNADNPGYLEQMTGWRANWIEGFTGLWLSPSKGILTNSPIFIFIFYTFYEKFTNFFKKRETDFYFPLMCIVLIHIAVMGKWYSWYGGYSWGYRMASDVIPFLVILLIPFFEKFYEKKLWRLNAYLFGAISICTQTFGIIFFDGIWHTVFDGKDRWWLWSIYNSEYLFDIRRILFKFNLAENPVPVQMRAQ